MRKVDFWVKWNEMRVRLTERFPVAFVKNKQRRYPLKKNIHRDIHKEFNGEYSMREIKTFLKVWCNRTRYLKAVVANLPRIDLEGYPAGEVSEEDRITAGNRLAERLVKRGYSRNLTHVGSTFDSFLEEEGIYEEVMA